MEDANLYVILAWTAEQNTIYRKRIKGFEILSENLSNEVDRQAKEIELLRQPKKTYNGKSYLRKAA